MEAPYGATSARPTMGWSSWLSYVQTFWRYRSASKRDLRLDFLRGLCICIMVTDHIGGLSPLRVLTGNNSFFVSAAEGFVFISGLLLGEVYRKLIARDGFRAAVAKALARAWKLYTLTVIMTVLLSYASWYSGWAWVDQQEIQSPLRFAIRVLTFRRSYPYSDVLVMYSLLMLGAPIALWLLNRGWTWALLVGSWALWLAYQISPYGASQPLPTIQSFHPAPWQIFFVHAMALGYHRQRVAAWFHQLPKFYALIGLSLLFVGLIVLYITGGTIIEPLIPSDANTFLAAVFTKNTVRIGRILAALVVFPLAFMIITYIWTPLRRLFGWLLLPLGQSSLYSYVMHLPLLLLFAFIYRWPPGMTPREQVVNTLIQVSAILVLWIMVKRRFLFGIVPQ